MGLDGAVQVVLSSQYIRIGNADDKASVSDFEAAFSSFDFTALKSSVELSGVKVALESGPRRKKQEQARTAQKGGSRRASFEDGSFLHSQFSGALQERMRHRYLPFFG